MTKEGGASFIKGEIKNTMEKLEVLGKDNPLPRFGHTVTLITKGKAILFGGATGDTGRYSIAGDTYGFDLVSKTWKKIEATGNSPSPRAAHASVAVEMNQLVIYGGATGGGSLASDDLYLLDLRANDDTGVWTIVPVIGTTPGRRYGHTLTYSRPYLVVFGGNTGGQEPVNDCWVLNVEKSPFSWLKLECKSESPYTRVYHSAALCQIGSANGMIVIFGGRSSDQVALNDTWGLRRHRDGRWDWVKAPYKNEKDSPIGRYQHSSLFLGSAMIVIGGRTNNVGENVGLDIYDTETSEWTKFPSVQRFRHASWLVESSLLIYGGFEHDSPNIPTDSMTKLNLLKLFQGNDNLMRKAVNNATGTPPHMQQNKSAMSTGTSTPTLSSPNTSMEVDSKRQGSPSLLSGNLPAGGVSGKFNTDNFKQAPGKTGATSNEKQFKMASKAVVVEEQRHGEMSNKIMTYSIDEPSKAVKINKYNTQLAFDNQLHNQFISILLQPKNYINMPENARFLFKSEHIVTLCDYAQSVLETQPMVLKVRAPIKIYGDIHGQYSDLMRFFDLWGAPCENGKDGDIESFDYLYLGDFVDRGSHSLETICLLLALKVKYPEQVHLIRGNHEDKWINNGFGFSEECASRLQEDPNDEDSVFMRVNRLFDWLPLCAVIEEKVICLHGGIGSSLNYVEEIETLARPLEVVHEVSTLEQQLVVDILWSDPTDSDVDLGIHPNTIRDPGGTGNIVKFGPDRVQQFLKNNNLSLIIRAHECVMDGFERFAGGQLITVFSATDYCGKHKNAGAVLILKKNFEIIPKLIYPSSASNNNWLEDEETLKKRPPTPPRWKNPLPRKSSYD